MVDDWDPFAEVPSEVPLTNAPLVRVIAQAKFSDVFSVEKREFVAAFQERMRSRYPVVRDERMVEQVTFNAEGIVPGKSRTAWRFLDVNDHWRVSLTSNFVALETTVYSSREDFFSRFETIVEALQATVRPEWLERLGVRYIDRVAGDAVGSMSTFVRPEVAGALGTRLAQYVQHSVTETMFKHGDRRIIARWGHLPPGATIDPAALEPVNEPSWILDLDMFRDGRVPFTPDGVVADAKSFATQLYGVFRWAVTSEFLRHYGGRV
jgi:uncharacterized protein (TIGR04255 family)